MDNKVALGKESGYMQYVYLCLLWLKNNESNYWRFCDGKCYTKEEKRNRNRGKIKKESKTENEDKSFFL